MSPVYLGVVGAGDAGSELLAVAHDVGAHIARRGALLVCGGLGGVMEAACRGAKEAGGTTIGILPSLDRTQANPYLDVAIPSGLGEMRDALIVRASDALVAVGGEFGTLSEIALALKTNVPVVGIDVWELRKGGKEVRAVTRAGSASEAVDEALRLATRA